MSGHDDDGAPRESHAPRGGFFAQPPSGRVEKPGENLKPLRDAPETRSRCSWCSWSSEVRESLDAARERFREHVLAAHPETLTGAQRSGLARSADSRAAAAAAEIAADAARRQAAEIEARQAARLAERKAAKLRERERRRRVAARREVERAERRAEIERRLAAGQTIRRIAADVRCSPQTVLAVKKARATSGV